MREICLSHVVTSAAFSATRAIRRQDYRGGTMTTVIDLSILTQRAAGFSRGATIRSGPCLGGRGAPSKVSATITSESTIPESSSAMEKATR